MATKRKFAEDTIVTVERSQEEAKKLLRKYGADQIRVTEASDHTRLEFRLSEWVIRFDVSAPDPGDTSLEYTRSGQWRPVSQRAAARQREYQRRFRALILRLKAKLEAVSSDDVLVTEEFLGQIVIGPQGETIAELVVHQLEEAKQTGRVPELLPVVTDRALPLYMAQEEER